MLVLLALLLTDPPTPTPPANPLAALYPADRPIVVPLWTRVGDFSTRLRSIEAAEFSPDGTLVVSGAKFGYDVILWRVVDGTVVWRQQHESEVECVCFSPDGRRIATGGEDFQVRVWDTATGEQLAAIEHPRGIDAIAWHGTTLAAGDEAGTLHLHETTADDPAAWSSRQVATGDTINSIAFTADGSQIVVGGNLQQVETDAAGPVRHFDGFARAIDAATLETVAEYGPLVSGIAPNGRMRSGSIKSVAISPDGSTVAVGGFGRSVQTFDRLTGQLRRTIRLDQRIEAVAFTPGGHYLVAGGHEPALLFYRTAELDQAGDPDAPIEPAAAVPCVRVEYIDFTTDGRLMVTSHEDSGLLRVFLLASDLQRRTGPRSGGGSLYDRLSRQQLDNRDLQPASTD